eukprot:scaffold13672_cov28-Tisochrysis_lutea.AAC.5
MEWTCAIRRDASVGVLAASGVVGVSTARRRFLSTLLPLGHPDGGHVLDVSGDKVPISRASIPMSEARAGWATIAGVSRSAPLLSSITLLSDIMLRASV